MRRSRRATFDWEHVAAVTRRLRAPGASQAASNLEREAQRTVYSTVGLFAHNVSTVVVFSSSTLRSPRHDARRASKLELGHAFKIAIEYGIII